MTWRFNWRATAHIAALHLPAALVLGCVAWVPRVESTLLIFAAFAGLAGVVVHFTARSKTRSAARRLVLQPATVVALLGNALLLGVSLTTHRPIWAPTSRPRVTWGGSRWSPPRCSPSPRWLCAARSPASC